MKRLIPLAAAAAIVAIAGCARKEAAKPAQTAAAAQAPAAPVAPDSFQVRFETSRGPFTVAVTRSLSPLGAARFYELVMT
ncbi:MAG: peptidylprolyl isomerase, partial [Gemmatimonadota bacterium]|nr:peptidylprolyl isomerase [Gemmatimonadota bacterium]